MGRGTVRSDVQSTPTKLMAPAMLGHTAEAGCIPRTVPVTDSLVGMYRQAGWLTLPAGDGVLWRTLGGGQSGGDEMSGGKTAASRPAGKYNEHADLAASTRVRAVGKGAEPMMQPGEAVDTIPLGPLTPRQPPCHHLGQARTYTAHPCPADILTRDMQRLALVCNKAPNFVR